MTFLLTISQTSKLQIIQDKKNYIQKLANIGLIDKNLNFPFTLEVISYCCPICNCCFFQEHMGFYAHTKAHPQKQNLDHYIFLFGQGNKVTLLKNTDRTYKKMLDDPKTLYKNRKRIGGRGWWKIKYHTPDKHPQYIQARRWLVNIFCIMHVWSVENWY